MVQDRGIKRVVTLVMTGPQAARDQGLSVCFGQMRRDTDMKRFLIIFVAFGILVTLAALTTVAKERHKCCVGGKCVDVEREGNCKKIGGVIVADCRACR